MHLPNGSQIFIESQRQLQGQVSAIQKGRDAIVTVVGHSLVSGDVVVFQGGGMDGMYAKVQRYDTNRFFLRGTDNFLRSKNFDFVGSLCYKVTAWTEIPCVQDINFEGGEQQYYNYQCLSDDREQQLKTFKSAQSVTITYAWEFSDAVNDIARKADEDEVKRLVYMTIPRAKEVRYWSGTISFNSTVNTTVNEMETTSLTVNLAHPQSQMPEVISDVIPVESITVMIDSLIPGQVQIGEYAGRRISLFPSTANSNAVDWELSNDKVAEIVSGSFTGIKGKSEGMAELAVTSRDSGGARGAVPFQVIPAIQMSTATIDYQLPARRAKVGTSFNASVVNPVPANSGEEVQLELTSNGAARIENRSYNGRSTSIAVVGASTFKVVLSAYFRGNTGGGAIRVTETPGWIFGFRELVSMNGLTDISDSNWPTAENFRNLIKFEHSGTRRITKMRASPNTTDFLLFECGGSARVDLIAGPDMPLEQGSYSIMPDKSVALVAQANGKWTLQVLN